MYQEDVRVVRRNFVTQHHVSSVPSSAGDEVPRPYVNHTDEFGRAIAITDPNVHEEWRILGVHNDNMVVTIIWECALNILEPEDPNYTPVPTPLVVPRQRLFISLELLTREEIQPPVLENWLDRRLQGCPLGIITLKSVTQGPSPTFWGHIGDDQETIETPDHLKDPLPKDDDEEK